MDIFHNGTKSVPKNTPNSISRVPFDKSDIGARKSHLSGIAPKNSNTIVHVKGS